MINNKHNINDRSFGNSSVSIRKTSSDALLIKWTRLLLWLHQVKFTRPYIELMESIIKLRKSSGTKMTVQYLKTAHLLLAHFISGNPKTSEGIDKPRVATSKGIPLIVPSSLRSLIGTGDQDVIKIVFCILSVYRILKYEGTLKLSTITDPFKGISGVVVDSEFDFVFNKLFKPIRGINPMGLDRLAILRTAGPNYKTSILGAPLDAVAIHRSGWALEPIQSLSRYFGGSIHELLKAEIEMVKDLTCKHVRLGKLSKKDEPAGKIRVFAIVDVWTQSVLKPIHDHLYSILKKIDQDGTFDQLNPVKILLERIKLKEDKFVASYDLSAATDRFPISFQKQLLSRIYTKEVSSCWSDLLVKRDYEITDASGKTDIVRYSVGQPMGALSSWGTFALSHHFVIQLCASRLGHSSWFQDYALLGDDIVIADKAVATEYHRYMTITLGVEINLSKSIRSDIGVLEFAKRLVSPTCDFSPIGPGNLWMCLTTPSAIPSLFVDGIQKGLLYEQERVKEMLCHLPRDIFSISKGKLEQLLFSLIGPFGIIKDSLQFGPLRAETPWTAVQGKTQQTKAVWLNLAVDTVLLDYIEDKRHSAIVKSSRSMDSIMGRIAVDGFTETIKPLSLPSYMCLVMSSLEDYSKLFDPAYHIDLVSEDDRNYSTISNLVLYKLDLMPAYSPITGLTASVEQKPRFRTIGVEFFIKVNKLSKRLFDKWLWSVMNRNNRWGFKNPY